MKFSFMLLVLFSTFEVLATVQQVKIESNFKLQFNDAKWTYQYVKALSSITPHVFESKIDKNLKVIIQKETHAEVVKNRESLVGDKCELANKFYQESKQGSAKSIRIKNKNVCLIEQVKNGQKTFQIIYPARFESGSYDLISFAWKGGDSKSLEEVSALVGENL